MRRFLTAVLTWSLLTTIAFVVGAAAFIYVRHHVPRCTIRGSEKCLHVSDDGSWLPTEALAGVEQPRGPIRLYNARTGQCEAEFAADAQRVSCEISPNGRWLVAAEELTGKLHIIDWAQRQVHEVAVGRTVQHYHTFGHWCMANVFGGEHCLIDLNTGEVARRFPGKNDFRVDRLQQRWLFANRRDAIDVWDLDHMRLEASLHIACSALEPSPDGRWLAALQDGVWTLWDVTARAKLPIAELASTRVQFSADGSLLGVLHNNERERSGRTRVYELPTGRLVLDHDAPRL